MFASSKKGFYAFIFQDQTFEIFEQRLLYRSLCKTHDHKYFEIATITEDKRLIMILFKTILIWSVDYNLNFNGSDQSNKKIKEVQFKLLHIQNSQVAFFNHSYLAKHAALISSDIDGSGKKVITFVNNQLTQNLEVISKHLYQVLDLSFSQDNQLLVSTSLQECIIWKNSLEILKILSFGGVAVQFINNSQIILHSFHQGIIIFDWQQSDNGFQVVHQMDQFKSCIFILKKNYFNKLIIDNNKIQYSFQYHDSHFYFIWSIGKKSIFVQNSYFQGSVQTCIDLKNQKIIHFEKNSKQGDFSSFYNGFFQQFITTGLQFFVALTNNNQIFLGDEYERNIKLFSQDGEILHQYQFSDIQDIQFLNETCQLIVISSREITVLNYRDIIESSNKQDLQPTVFHTFKLDKDFKKIKIIEKLSMLISFSELMVHTWDVKAKQSLLPFQVDISNIKSIAISQDGEAFATGNQNGKVKISYLQSSTSTNNDESYHHSVDQLFFNIDNLQLMSHSKLNSTTVIYDVKDKQLLQIQPDVLKSTIIKNRLQVLTTQHEILISEQQFDKKLQYLELFEEIQLNLDDTFRCIYFYFPKNMIYLATVSLNYCRIYNSQNFYNQKSKFKEIWRGEKFKIFFNKINSENYLVNIKDKRVVYCFENQIEYNWGDQKCCLLRSQLRLIHFHGSYLIMTDEGTNKIILMNAAHFQYMNMILYDEIELIGHNSEVISILAYQVYIISIDQDGIMIFWNLEDFQIINRFDLKPNLENYGKCQSQEISQNEKLLATGHENGILLIWDIENKKEIILKYKFQVPGSQIVEFIQFFITDNVVACLSNQFIWYFNLNKAQKNSVYRSTFKCQKQFSFDPINQKLFCFNQNQFKAFYIYDSFNCQELQIAEEIGVRRFCKNDENILIYSNQEKFLKIYDVENQKQVGQTEYRIQPKQIIVSQSDRVIATLNVENEFECWFVATFQNITYYNLHSELNKNVTCMDITYDDQNVIFGNTNLEVIIMQLKTSQVLLKLNNFTQVVTSLKFSLNQQNFALGFNDGSIFLYSYNYYNLDPITQFNDKDFQLDLTKAPLLIKVFGRNPSLLAQQCKLNKNTKILTQDIISLTETFKELGAIQIN